MEMMGAELWFMVRNTKQTTLPGTCAHSLNMMYRVLFVFLEIDQSSKCFQVSEKVRKKMSNCLVFLDKVGFWLKESINVSIFKNRLTCNFRIFVFTVAQITNISWNLAMKSLSLTSRLMIRSSFCLSTSYLISRDALCRRLIHSELYIENLCFCWLDVTRKTGDRIDF